jgi:adenylate cyclase
MPRQSSLLKQINIGKTAALLMLIAIVGLRIADPPAFELLRLKTFDFYQTVVKAEDQPRQILIVDIDESSLDRIGQWPWPRTRIAELVSRITADGAAAIAIDVLFPEYDRMSPGELAKLLEADDPSVAERLKALPSNDQKLAAAFMSSRVVLGQSAFHKKNVQWHADVEQRHAFAVSGPEPDPFLDSYPGIVRNVPELENAAGGLGMVTIRPDIDGVVRKLPLIVKADGRVLPSLALELLRVATGQTTVLMRTGDAGVNSLLLAGVEFPTDTSGKAWLHFKPHDPGMFISAADVIEGKTSATTFAGKLVLIGTSATGLFDLKTTPVDPAMPGVEVHAQLIAAMIGNQLLQRPSWAVGAEVLLTVLLGLVMIALLPRLGAGWTLGTGAATAAGIAGGAWWLFASKGIILDFAFPLLGTLAVTAAMIVVGYLNEEVQRRQIRAAFGQYLSPELVNQLAENPERLVLGGETRTMSIMFSDVRGFTAISETYKNNPQGLTELINRLLTPMSAAVVNRRGTIDKYMGDNIMAFWNAPLPDDDHAGNACGAALDMLVALDRVNVAREGEIGPDGMPVKPLKVGVGINTGQCVVGNMGSDLRFDYTVLGDCVNLASRLEGQTKGYGVKLIIGEQTAALVKGRFALLPLDRIRVIGKVEPEEIFTVVGECDVLASPAFAALAQSHEKLLASYRAMNWDDLDVSIRECLEHAKAFELEGLYLMYKARGRAFRETPPPSDWDGVFDALSK